MGGAAEEQGEGGEGPEARARGELPGEGPAAEQAERRDEGFDGAAVDDEPRDDAGEEHEQDVHAGETEEGAADAGRERVGRTEGDDEGGENEGGDGEAKEPSACQRYSQGSDQPSARRPCLTEWLKPRSVLQ